MTTNLAPSKVPLPLPGRRINSPRPRPNRRGQLKLAVINARLRVSEIPLLARSHQMSHQSLRSAVGFVLDDFLEEPAIANLQGGLGAAAADRAAVVRHVVDDGVPGEGILQMRAVLQVHAELFLRSVEGRRDFSGAWVKGVFTAAAAATA